MATAFVALGANLGDRLASLRSAVAALDRVGEITAASTVYETDPVGYLDQPPFMNAVVRLQTELAARPLLETLLRIEAQHGRSRTIRNAPRTLDLDLLLYDNVVLDEPELTVPHPRLHERAFVLAPLAEVGGSVVHPVINRTIADLWSQMRPTAKGVRPLADLLRTDALDP